MPRFILVRHAVTQSFTQGTLRGASDNPPSQEGYNQARLRGDTLRSIPLGIVFSGPLSRAMDTTVQNCQSRNLEPALLDGLREMDFGFLEGKRKLWRLVRGNKLLVTLFLIPRQIFALVSDNPARHFRRLVLTIGEHIKQWQSYGTVDPVVSANVLRTIQVHVFGRPHLAMDRFSLNACSPTELHIPAYAQTAIIPLNDITHLGGGGSD